MKLLEMIAIEHKLQEARKAIKKTMGDSYGLELKVANEIVDINAKINNVSRQSASIDLAKRADTDGQKIKSLMFLIAGFGLESGNGSEEKGSE